MQRNKANRQKVSEGPNFLLPFSSPVQHNKTTTKPPKSQSPERSRGARDVGEPRSADGPGPAAGPSLSPLRPRSTARRPAPETAAGRHAAKHRPAAEGPAPRRQF